MRFIESHGIDYLTTISCDELMVHNGIHVKTLQLDEGPKVILRGVISGRLSRHAGGHVLKHGSIKMATSVFDAPDLNMHQSRKLHMRFGSERRSR